MVTRVLNRMNPAFKDKDDEKMYKAKLAARRKAGHVPAGTPAGGLGVTPSVEAELKVSFGKIDTSGDGYCTFDEMMGFLTSSGKQMSKEEAIEMMLEIDDNEDGYIDFTEFVLIMQRAPNALPYGVRTLVNSVGSLGGALTATLGAFSGLTRAATNAAISVVGGATSESAPAEPPAAAPAS
jgi:hypothetical protein